MGGVQDGLVVVNLYYSWFWGHLRVHRVRDSGTHLCWHTPSTRVRARGESQRVERRGVLSSSRSVCPISRLQPIQLCSPAPRASPHLTPNHTQQSLRGWPCKKQLPPAAPRHHAAAPAAAAAGHAQEASSVVCASVCALPVGIVQSMNEAVGVARDRVLVPLRLHCSGRAHPNPRLHGRRHQHTGT